MAIVKFSHTVHLIDLVTGVSMFLPNPPPSVTSSPWQKSIFHSKPTTHYGGLEAYLPFGSPKASRDVLPNSNRGTAGTHAHHYQYHHVSRHQDSTRMLENYSPSLVGFQWSKLGEDRYTVV
ncbi:hypothetical protein N7452_010240 [Penicillium brevicompactum]|uniref:Uncharacterized protein n=1 Tax=Penicillium brevicompactum TaxID=5074 RepID=A0A9W9QA72_PENBR|nr:hypothetical protein N7452_010240 [Penicillium brevicompactum]